MRAEIISIGTELLLGEVIDTNAGYLACQLPLVGADLRWVSTVGDNLDGLKDVFHRAVERSELVIATGGLGPTGDDLTRESIAAVIGEEPVVSAVLLEEIQSFFRRFGREMPSHNIKQALLVPSAESIPNPRGTAPGWWVEKNGVIIIAMPGPPQEMERMWQCEVAPRLQRKILGKVIQCRTLKTFGRSEAETDEMAAPIYALKDLDLGIYAKPDGIHLRVVAKAPDSQEAKRLLDDAEQKTRTIFGDNIWGVDNDTLEQVVGDLLIRKGLTIATMESFTGGLLASSLTDVPGSSAYFKGGLVAYSNEAKIAFGVRSELVEKHGAVSPQVAEAMAEAARRNLGADIGIGTTGVAGPDPLEGKMPGMAFIAIADGGVRSVEGHYPPRRPDVKRLATIHSLFLLRQVLLTLPATVPDP